jgi:hypothetical protein
LESSRATSDESLIEVAVSLCAIEHILGENESTNDKNAAAASEAVDKKVLYLSLKAYYIFN